jgi:hypothetical protein
MHETNAKHTKKTAEGELKHLNRISRVRANLSRVCDVPLNFIMYVKNRQQVIISLRPLDC